MTDELLREISGSLNIPRIPGRESEWIARIAYSVAGKMALASLWDHAEGGDTVSIQHFKSRIKEVFEAFEGIYPELDVLLPPDCSELAEEMYSIYLRTGWLYHSAHQIAPAAPCCACRNNTTLHRGSAPDDRHYMSGLGAYTIQKKTNGTRVEEMFGLQEQTLETYLEELLQGGGWSTADWPEKTEFLRLEAPFSRGYWQQTPYRDGRVGLARWGEPERIYLFYRSVGGAYQQKVIPEWRLRDAISGDVGERGEYRRIAAALLKRCGTLPEIRVDPEGELVEIHLGYRLPPSEEQFFKLYSWPMRYDFSSKSPQVFTRRMARAVYPIFKAELERIGYRFVEE